MDSHGPVTAGRLVVTGPVDDISAAAPPDEVCRLDLETEDPTPSPPLLVLRRSSTRMGYQWLDSVASPHQ